MAAACKPGGRRSGNVIFETTGVPEPGALADAAPRRARRPRPPADRQLLWRPHQARVVGWERRCHCASTYSARNTARACSRQRSDKPA